MLQLRTQKKLDDIAIAIAAVPKVAVGSDSATVVANTKILPPPT
jgi:hypothetical protein